MEQALGFFRGTDAQRGLVFKVTVKGRLVCDFAVGETVDTDARE